MRGLIVLVALIVTGFAFGDKEVDLAANEEMVKLHISNAVCDTCVRSIDDSIQNIIGIEQYDFDEDNHVVTITYNSVVMEGQWIKKVLEANGYEVRIV